MFSRCPMTYFVLRDGSPKPSAAAVGPPLVQNVVLSTWTGSPRFNFWSLNFFTFIIITIIITKNLLLSDVESDIKY